MEGKDQLLKTLKEVRPMIASEEQLDVLQQNMNYVCTLYNFRICQY